MQNLNKKLQRGFRINLCMTTVRKKIYCLKCDSELRQLLKTDSINDNWICPKHGSVKKGYIKTVNL